MASAKPLSADLMSSVSFVPPDYIQPVSKRPNLDEVSTEISIPVVDLQGLNGPNCFDVIKEIGQACQSGCFQVKNHGIPKEVIDKMLSVSREFFHLPESERKFFSGENWHPAKNLRLSSTDPDAKPETVASTWSDHLMVRPDQLMDDMYKWPANHQSFREDLTEYFKNARELVLKLVAAISESLGLEKGYINQAYEKNSHQVMLINCYPPCPQPELTLGLPSHTDSHLITMILQDDVPGLQVIKDGKWVTVNPVPDTLFIMVADQLQVLSNDRYKSVLHRVTVNNEKERISIPFAYAPSPEAVVGPVPNLVDDGHPAVYRNFSYYEYYKEYASLSTVAATEKCLDMFKLGTSPTA